MLSAKIVVFAYGIALASALRGELQTLSDAEREEILTSLNAYRGDTNGGNMECLSAWDNGLEEKAQSNAMKCSDSVDDSENGVGVVYVNGSTTSMSDFTQQLNAMKDSYDYESDTCNGTNALDCKNYKQFVWWQGGKVGCSKAICRAPPSAASALLTCYFEKKAGSGKPYAQADSCSFCQNGYECANKLCCVRSTPSGGSSCGAKPKDLVALHRIVHKNRKDTVLTTSDTRKTQLLASGYVDKGTFGYVSKGGQADCPGLTPLVEMKGAGKADHVYVIGEEYLAYYSDKKYNFVSYVGYVVETQGFCSANETAYHFVRLSTYNYYTPSNEEAKELLTRTGTKSQYWFVDKAFALWGSSN